MGLCLLARKCSVFVAAMLLAVAAVTSTPRAYAQAQPAEASPLFEEAWEMYRSVEDFYLDAFNVSINGTLFPLTGEYPADDLQASGLPDRFSALGPGDVPVFVEFVWHEETPVQAGHHHNLELLQLISDHNPRIGGGVFIIESGHRSWVVTAITATSTVDAPPGSRSAAVYPLYWHRDVEAQKVRREEPRVWTVEDVMQLAGVSVGARGGDVAPGDPPDDPEPEPGPPSEDDPTACERCLIDYQEELDAIQSDAFDETIEAFQDAVDALNAAEQEYQAERERIRESGYTTIVVAVGAGAVVGFCFASGPVGWAVLGGAVKGGLASSAGVAFAAPKADQAAWDRRQDAQQMAMNELRDRLQEIVDDAQDKQDIARRLFEFCCELRECCEELGCGCPPGQGGGSTIRESPAEPLDHGRP